MVPAAELTQLSDRGKEQFAELLDAMVSACAPCPYGTELVLDGVDPQLLVQYDQAIADCARAESARSCLCEEDVYEKQVSASTWKRKAAGARFYTEKKETTLETELEDFLAKLYEKYVPAQTREYIESMENLLNLHAPASNASPALRSIRLLR